VKEVKALEEHVHLLEKEISTLADGLEKVTASYRGCEDMKQELRALLVFLERRYPELKKELPEILRKT